MSAPSAAWRVARASVAGSRHRASGLGCDDASGWAAVPALGQDTLVAAVADGMSSARQGARGARIAVNIAVCAAVRQLHEHGSAPVPPSHLESILNQTILSARQRIQHVASRHDTPEHDLATTLLVAIHTSQAIGTAQVGDGAAVVSAADTHITLAEPKRGEYANETLSITSRRVMQLCSIDIVTPPEPVNAITLMTDGVVSMSISNRDNTPHPPFFQAMREWLCSHPGQNHPNRDLTELLQSPRIQSRTDDDTTLLIAVRK